MASLGFVGGCSFGGVTFGTIQGEGQYALEVGQDTNFDAQDIPYADQAALQLGGRKSGEFSAPILIDQANWTAFKGKRGQSATLSLHGQSWTATLLRWDTPRVSNLLGYVLTTATWFV